MSVEGGVRVTGFWKVGIGGVPCISGKNVVSKSFSEPGVLEVLVVFVRSFSGVTGGGAMADVVDLFFQRRR